LETVEDKDERNSSSVCTSAQQNNLVGKVKKNADNNLSRDFFGENGEELHLTTQEELNFDKKTPFPTTMDINLQKEKSDISALNLNESEFDFNAEGNDIIEQQNSFIDREGLFKQGDLSYVSGNPNDQDLNHSGYMNRSGLANFKQYNTLPKGMFEPIVEDNENSYSINQPSHEESKGKISSHKSLSKKKSGDSDEEEERHSIEDFFNSSAIDAQSPLGNFTIKDRGSNNREIKGVHDKFSFNLRPIERKEDITLDLELRNSSIKRSKFFS
jgi:hypothetical protein